MYMKDTSKPMTVDDEIAYNNYKLTADKIFSIMSQQKPNQVEKIKIPASRFEKYFSRGTPQSQIESVIFQALEEYYAKRR